MLNAHFSSVFALISAFLIAAPAVASPGGKVVDGKCVKTSYGNLLVGVTNYPAYQQIPEAEYSVGPLRMLKMTKSSEIPRVAGAHDDSLVQVVLRPMNSQDGAVYPRFLIRCRLLQDTDTQAVHRCTWFGAGDEADYAASVDKFKTKFGDQWRDTFFFGLTDFQSEVIIQKESSQCPAGDVRLDYTITMEIKDDDMAKLKSSLRIPVFPLPENRIFELYYRHFYDGWIKKIEGA